jgi:hypothetical protein
VRGRIRRGTLPVEREGGTVYVLLEASAQRSYDRATGDQSRTTTDQTTDRTDLLIAELQDRVRSLEEANRENRRIIAALTSRIPRHRSPGFARGLRIAGEPRRPSEVSSDAGGGPQTARERGRSRRSSRSSARGGVGYSTHKEGRMLQGADISIDLNVDTFIPADSQELAERLRAETDLRVQSEVVGYTYIEGFPPPPDVVLYFVDTLTPLVVDVYLNVLASAIWDAMKATLSRQGKVGSEATFSAIKRDKDGNILLEVSGQTSDPEIIKDLIRQASEDDKS